MTTFTAKKAAMVILDSWLGKLCASPWSMDTGEMERQLSDYGWKVTAKRYAAILDQVEKILLPTKNRIANYIEKMN